MSKQANTILVTVVATLIAILVLQNIHRVSVRFIVWEGSFSLALLLPVVFLGGALTGWLWRRRKP